MALLAIGLVASGCTGSPSADLPPDQTSPVRSEPGPAAPGAPEGRTGAGWVVSLGDSYISGEGARWGANTTGPARRVDALGPNAYFDRRGRESEPGCHRASRSIVSSGLDGTRGKNVACSGATTRSDASGVRYKPGLDFDSEPDGDGVGQARALQRFAAGHRVSAVVVSIGGNDFGFAALVGRCVGAYLSSGGGPAELCRDDADLQTRFGPTNQRRVQAAATHALDRVTTAMSRAGYDDGDFRRVVMTYPSPIPPGSLLRSEPSGVGPIGCPVFAADATWANNVALARINASVATAAAAASAPFEVLDLSAAFFGHRLCERGTRLLSETGLSRWDSPGAVDAVEWVNQVYLTLAPHQIQESLHPGYWGTAAERACLRLTLAAAGRTSYRCVGAAGGGLLDGAPQMTLR